jgi:hypothetical protein
MRSPSVRAAPTGDLRAELNRNRAVEDTQASLEWLEDLRSKLNCRRASENTRISLERARECRQNPEGCNLEQDFTVVTPQIPGGA